MRSRASGSNARCGWGGWPRRAGLGWRIAAVSDRARLLGAARHHARTSLISGSLFVLAAVVLASAISVGIGRTRRASERAEGKIIDYNKEFYQRFEDLDPHAIADDNMDARSLATTILEGIEQGRFRVSA